MNNDEIVKLTCEILSTLFDLIDEPVKLKHFINDGYKIKYKNYKYYYNLEPCHIFWSYFNSKYPDIESLDNIEDKDIKMSNNIWDSLDIMKRCAFMVKGKSLYENAPYVLYKCFGPDKLEELVNDETYDRFIWCLNILKK